MQALFRNTKPTAKENISDLNFGDVSQEGTTPLHLAMYERREEAALALLDAGASTSAKNRR
jgi:ankyrin repeat protein